MPNIVAETFRQAAAWNLQNPARKGNTVRLEGEHDVLVSGDLHGNRGGLAKIVRHADLGKQTARVLVLQEIIHGPPDAAGADRSVDCLLRAVRLMLQYPGQVLFLMGNHDLAQAVGNEITKEGRGVVKGFTAAVLGTFAADGPEVLAAIHEFLLSLPLAIRCPNGVMLCHSLPSPGRLPPSGADILDRANADADLMRGGAVYEWIWGRGQTAEQIDELAGRLGVTFFILGHRHTPLGWERISPRCIVLASDQDKGCIVSFGTGQAVTDENVEGLVKPLAGI